MRKGDDLGPYLWLTDPEADPEGPNTCGSYGYGTLLAPPILAHLPNHQYRVHPLQTPPPQPLWSITPPPPSPLSPVHPLHTPFLLFLPDQSTPQTSPSTFIQYRRPDPDWSASFCNIRSDRHYLSGSDLLDIKICFIFAHLYSLLMSHMFLWKSLKKAL